MNLMFIIFKNLHTRSIFMVHVWKYTKSGYEMKNRKNLFKELKQFCFYKYLMFH